MKIENRTLRVPARPRDAWLERVSGTLHRQLEADAYPPRLSVVEVRDGAAHLRRGISLQSLRRPLGPVRRAATTELPALAMGNSLGPAVRAAT